MRGRKSIVLLGILALVALFGAAFYYVFEGSFERGEMYPEHSTMRADPRGTMILYETLEQMDGVEAIRWHERFAKWREQELDHPEDTTLIMLDAYPDDLMDPALDNFVVRGGRLVVSMVYSPYWGEYEDEEDHGEQDEAKNDEPKQEQDPDDQEDENEEEDQLADIGQALQRLSVQDDQQIFADFALLDRDSPMTTSAPPAVAWEAGLYLDEEYQPPEAPAWDQLYIIDQRHTVIVGRQMGRGEIIVLANGLPLTNETMFGQAEYGFLKWLLGNRETVVFDEYHFGIVKPRGIAMLIREYNLELTILALLFSFLLFIWHGAAPLMSSVDVKLRAGPNRQTVISGYRDLLRRYVDGKNILLVCLDEWKAVFMARKSDQKRYAAQFTEAENVAMREMNKPRKERNYKTAYRNITTILNQRRQKP